MKFLSSIILALASVSAKADCENPVFKASASWGDNTISITLAPEQQKVPDDSNICVAYRGEDSCCSADTLSAVDSAVTVVHDAIEETKQVIKDIDIKKDFQTNLIDIACSAVFILDATKASKCKTITSSHVEQMEKKVVQLANDSLNCADSMLGYKAGMLCFACTNNWSDYVDAEKKMIKVAKSTCTSIAASCTPMMNDSRDVIVLFGEMIKELLELGLSSSIDITANFPDFCGGTTSTPGDCAKMVCDTWLSGLHYNIKSSFGSSRRQLVESELAEMHPEIVDLFLHVIGNVENVLAPLANANSHGSEAEHRLLANAASNTYTDDGYDAYGNGCKEPNVNCPNLYFWWWVAGGAVVVVALAGVTGFVVMKKKRGTGYSSELGSRS